MMAISLLLLALKSEFKIQKHIIKLFHVLKNLSSYTIIKDRTNFFSVRTDEYPLGFGRNPLCFWDDAEKLGDYPESRLLQKARIRIKPADFEVRRKSLIMIAI